MRETHYPHHLSTDHDPLTQNRAPHPAHQIFRWLLEAGDWLLPICTMLVSMNITEPLGIPGAPNETLEAVLVNVPAEASRLIMLTDTQGDRLHAGYAALLVTGHGDDAIARITAPAFGPRYGEAGTVALVALGHWAASNGLPIRETVLNSSDFNRVIAEPDAQEVAALIAASNPSDVGIYTTEPKKQDD